MAVLRPLRVVIENFPEGRVEQLVAANHPKDETLGTRSVPFSRVIVIDREDFHEQAPKGFKRLVQGGEVRLRYGYVIRCEEVIKAEGGEILELRCTYDADTLGRNPEGRKVPGVIHWVSAEHAGVADVRLYDRLFTHPTPDAAKEGGDFTDYLNADSLRTLTGCLVEPALVRAAPGERFQFEREGYFVVDTRDSREGKLVFNRTVPLRDTWARMELQSR
jgi:glutaminyl-tRNA synthetase